VSQEKVKPQSHQALGFWGCWSLSVGVMIGSGVFLLPSVLAPYGLLSFGGWLLSAGGAILIALVLGRLAGRTERTGGPFAFAHDAFGDLPGFLVGWGYWISVWIATPTIAIAFVGYLTIFIPGLSDQPVWQAIIALGLIWALTLNSMRGAKDFALTQIIMTVLKLVPLFVIIGLGLLAGQSENLPEPNPSEGSLFSVLPTVALLTMWAFLGMETGTIPAGDVRNPERTIPKAVVIGTITVASVYIASTAAVMMLVPADQLAQSTSPFADAARGLGQWGPSMIAIGALIATAGSMNGNIFISGQLPMALSLDKLAPKFLANLNPAGAPKISLLLGSTLSSVLLVTNYSRGLIGAFTFFLMMSTLTALIPYLVSSIAELRYSWKTKRAWAFIALVAAIFSIYAIYGSGLDVIFWGAVLMVIGVPVFYLGRQKP